MAWRCYMLAVIAVVFSGCFKKVHSVGELPRVYTESKVICPTAACYATAAAMVEKMNLSADPCEDFDEFACGRFHDEYVLPNGTVENSPFMALHINNTVIMNEILANATRPTQPQYVAKMRRMYKSCLNETQMEVVGVTPYLNDRAFVDDWPTLNPSWSEASFDYNEVITRYSGVSIFPIFEVSAEIDMINTSRYIVQVNQPLLGLRRTQFMQPRNNSVIMAYEKYLAETAIELNASREVAERDARDVVDLEIELARINVPLEQQRNFIKQVNHVKLSQFAMLYPRLDIARAIRSTFSVVNITLPDDEIVNSRFPTHLKNIESVLECFPKRTIQNYFGFRYAEPKVAGLTRRLRNVYLDFARVSKGIQTPSPRWQYCVSKVAEIFPQAMSKQFVGRVFSQTAKNSTLVMIGDLKGEFRKMIENATWMSSTTKGEALKKLAAMRSKIGFPDAEFEDADIERRYENYTISEDNYYNNVNLGVWLEKLRKLALLRKPIDQNTWYIAPYHVNAFASVQENAIVFLGGFMQSPFYSELFPNYVNYAAIGTIIGHEITHLFDDMGKQFDEKGNLRNWWTKEDEENFRNRNKCIIDQYNNFYIAEINMTLNGLITQGESEGDTSGLKESFRAYKQRILRSSNPMWLPNLNLSPDKLFFLSFAQVWCQKFTTAGLINQATSGQHPPGKYRLTGALQNSEDFARVYNCPRGSYMNPARKCGVW